MLDAVLPLTLRDLARFRILERSLAAHFQTLRTCWVVVPDRECLAVARALPRRVFQVVPETEVVPELANCRAPGWHKQQLVKLAMADVVRTDQYLLLDADVICARPIELSDLVKDGRARCYRYRADRHARWYRWAERVLRVKRSGWVHGVTPAVLDRRAVWQLAVHLNGRQPRPGQWRGMLVQGLRKLVGASPIPSDNASPWRQMLLDSLPWTEYSLYFTYLEATSQFDRYHFHSDQSLYGNCVWARQRLAEWDPLAQNNGHQPPFTIVQSIAGIPPEEVWQRAAPIWRGKAA